MNAYTRIQWLHEQIKAFRYPNAQRLCERFSISHRQAQRDLRYLREELGAPLAYHAEKRGFAYTADFSLPVYIRNVGDGDYISLLDTQFDTAGEGIDPAHPHYVQLQIPFTATLRIPDKLAQMSFNRFIIKESDSGADCFLCEFANVDLFLSAILMLDSTVQILSPVWLRERLCAIARRAVDNHREFDIDEN
ncbi:MAG: hypothetical protein IKD37_02895 [Clostridia bacterium]|nr:hypothetical protein [Clostridia bacterium]